MIGAHAVDRADEDREGAGIDDHRDLTRIARAGEQQRDGRHRRRRDGAQHVHQRLEYVAEQAHAADQCAKGDHDRDGNGETDRSAAQRVDDL